MSYSPFCTVPLYVSFSTALSTLGLSRPFTLGGSCHLCLLQLLPSQVHTSPPSEITLTVEPKVTSFFSKLTWLVFAEPQMERL